MLVFAFAARKGGVGKTTLAISYAVCAYQEAQRAGDSDQPLVSVVDLDSQGCATSCFNARDDQPGPVAHQAGVASLPLILNELEAQGYVAAFIDCPPGHGEITTAAMMAADVVVIPTKPSELDLAAAQKTIAMADTIGAPHILVVNDGHFRTKSVGEAVKQLRELGENPSVVHRRVDTALAGGRTVTERALGSRAATEMMDAYDALKGMVQPWPI